MTGKILAAKRSAFSCSTCVRMAAPLDGSWAAEFYAACLGGFQSNLGALANHLAFMLGYGGEDVNGQPVYLWHVHGDKLHPAFHESADKIHIPCQPVELGNHEGSFVFAARIERGSKFGTVVLASALNLGKKFDQLPTSSKEVTHGLLLGF